jgi:hypothetical protein
MNAARLHLFAVGRLDEPSFDRNSHGMDAAAATQFSGCDPQVMERHALADLERHRNFVGCSSIREQPQCFKLYRIEGWWHSAVRSVFLWLRQFRIIPAGAAGIVTHLMFAGMNRT